MVKACDKVFPHSWDWNLEISVSPLQSICKYLQNLLAGLNLVSRAFQNIGDDYYY